jgi:threonine dehydrogenase-like Zn-dependent dehydrogenase
MVKGLQDSEVFMLFRRGGWLGHEVETIRLLRRRVDIIGERGADWVIECAGWIGQFLWRVRQLHPHSDYSILGVCDQSTQFPMPGTIH